MGGFSQVGCFLDGTCMERFYNAAPYHENTPKGMTASIAKRVLIGLIVTAALAIGLYYASYLGNKAVNVFNLSERTLKIMAIVTASSIAFSGLAVTTAVSLKVYFNYKADRLRY